MMPVRPPEIVKNGSPFEETYAPIRPAASASVVFTASIANVVGEP